MKSTENGMARFSWSNVELILNFNVLMLRRKQGFTGGAI